MEKKLKDSRTGLLRERDRIAARVAKLDPILGSELKTVLMKLDSPQERTGDYAHFSVLQPLEAIQAYLEKTGEWTEARQIARTLMDGGFPLPPERGVFYLVRTINYRAGKGRLQKVGDLIGLPGWDSPKA